MVVLTGVVLAIVGALAGLVAELCELGPSSVLLRGVIVGGLAGLIFGCAVGAMQARHDAATGIPAPKHAPYMSLGIACLLLSVFSFVATQLVPGVRPLVVASVPLKLQVNATAQLSFTADNTAEYAVVLALDQGGGTDAFSQYLANQRKSDSKKVVLSPAMIEWSADVADSKRDRTPNSFPSPGFEVVGLGAIEAERGSKYTLTARVISSAPNVAEAKTSFEVHRSVAGWAKYIPRMLVAGAIGVLSGITGMMFLAYGGLLLYNSKRASAAT